MLVLSGLGAVAYQDNSNNNIKLRTETIQIEQPSIKNENDFVTLEMQDATQLIITGKPQIPVITKTFMFPAGTLIKDSNINIKYQTIELDHKIKPSPAPVALTTQKVEFQEGLHDEFDEKVYASSEMYPAEPYTINYGVGINEGEHVTYVNVRCNAQYSPANDIIKVPSTIEYNLDYTEPAEPFVQEAGYDLLIITHEKFEDQMLRLKEHKDSIGINTKILTVSDILETFEGVADWEKVKFAIENAVKTQGVEYVLLAGGHKGQTDEFWVPEFRSNNFDGAVADAGYPYDETYSCDLYYADLFQYDNTGTPIFSSWDTNGNGIYGEGPYYGNPDRPDFYPDVYFGRIPLRYSWEAEHVVDKIITYESTIADSSWFKRVVLLGGDTSPEERYGSGSVQRGVYEGELICDVTAEYLATVGFDSYKMYASENGDHQLNDGKEGDGSDELAPQLNDVGAGWVNMQGHANPAVLGNHIMDKEDFVYYYTIMDMNKFGGADGKYPFMVMDGCHNGQWDVTIQQAINAGGLAYPRAHLLEFIPTDITSWMVLKEDGGGIAAFGNTGLGYGYLNTAYNQGLGGWISPRWAHAYAIQGREYTGQIYVQGITDYINNFPVWSDDVDRKTIEERGLLGDPSIKLGGVGGGAALDSEDEEETSSDYKPALTANVPTWNVGDTWTYKLNTIDFTMQELEDRGIDLALSAGNIQLEVVDVSATSYVTEINCDDIDVAVELIFNSYTEEPSIFEVPPVEFENVELFGEIVWEKDTLAIDDVELSMILDIGKNLDGLPLELPSFIYSLQSIISIPAQLDLTVDFEDPWPLFEFPLEEDKGWGIPAGQATITIDGSVESVWLRILSFVNKFIPVIPEEFAQYLPNVDISEFLEDMGIPTEIDLPIAAMEEFLRKTPFKVSGQETVNVEAGSFSATRIKVAGGVGNLYYSEGANNFVQIYSPANDFLPAISNVNLELVE